MLQIQILTNILHMSLRPTLETLLFFLILVKQLREIFIVLLITKLFLMICIINSRRLVRHKMGPQIYFLS